MQEMTKGESMCKERKRNLSFLWNEISAKEPTEGFEVCCWGDTWAGTATLAKTELPYVTQKKTSSVTGYCFMSLSRALGTIPPHLEPAFLLLPTNWLPFLVLPRSSFGGCVVPSSAFCSSVCLPSLVSSPEKCHPVSFHNSYHLNTNTPKYTSMFPCHPQVVLFQILSCPSIFLASE